LLIGRMTSCTENQIRIQLSVDGELSSDEAEELQRHTETCADCQRALVDARDLSARIRAAKPDSSAPEILRQRLQQRMAAEQRRGALESKPGARVLPWRNWMVAATAAMLLIGIGSALLLYRRSEDRSAEMMHMAVTAHRELQANQVPLDIHTASSEDVSRWFEQRVSFPFHMANAGIASDDRAKYELVGGRLMSVRGEHVALLSFRLADELVSLLVGSGGFDVDSGGTVIKSDGIALHAHDEGGTHIVTWKNRGLSYVLVSHTSMANTGNCGRCHAAALSVPSSTARVTREFLNPVDRRVILAAKADIPADDPQSQFDR